MEIMKDYYTINNNIDSIFDESEGVIKTTVSLYYIFLIKLQIVQ